MHRYTFYQRFVIDALLDHPDTGYRLARLATVVASAYLFIRVGMGLLAGPAADPMPIAGW